MSWQLLLAIATFVLVTTGTPGPNNILLLNSGANNGVRRSLPLLFGINNGVVLMVILMMLGLGELFMRYPVTQTYLKVLGSGYLFYLAYKIATSPTTVKHSLKGGDSAVNESKVNRPMRWIEALLFQFINPKVWMMAITAASSFTLNGEYFYVSAAAVIIAFMTIGLGCNMSWVVLGVAIQKLLSTPARQRCFNWTMAGLTAATVFMII
jgi:threonine/homoserine/homoserine lactone efflux protein